MARPYEAFWPARLPKTLDYPEVPLFRLLEVTAEYFPGKTAINYYGKEISYRELWESVEKLAGALAKRGVKKGDRVAIYMQNSPHYIVGFYGIMRANAIVVPANPMLTEDELTYLLKDSGAIGIITTTDLRSRAEKAGNNAGLKFILVGSYSDYLPAEPTIPVPDFVLASSSAPIDDSGWSKALNEDNPLPPVEVTYQDLCLLPYTSGSTGVPKGCMHTHQTVISNLLSSYYWMQMTPTSVHLSVLPLFHVTGLIHNMLAPLYAGAKLVLLTRWDRQAAAAAIEKYGCTHWVNISTMVVDFLNAPDISSCNLSSLMVVGGGGAPLPEAIGRRLEELTGLKYVEGYGLTETISQTHFNPPDRPKLQCIGIPDFGVDARIVDTETLKELPANEQGELVIAGPEVFKGYWNLPEETAAAFIEIEGKHFFRTGDVCYMDEEGYFHILDRTKRMINAAGFKVWPAEIEGYLYQHPAIAEVCVVGVPDPVRIENVKAYVVLKPGYEGKITTEEIIAWSKERMAAYKYPRIIEFVNSLPKSGSGKIMWRVLQEREKERAKN